MLNNDTEDAPLNLRRNHKNMTLGSYYYDDQDVEHDVEVTFNYYAGRKGTRDSLGGKQGAGPPLEPDDEPEIEIVKIIDQKTKQETELDEDVMDRLVDECWELVYER